jgi:hypothetical protein
MSQELMKLVDDHAISAVRATSVSINGNPRRGFEIGRETDAIRVELAKQVEALTTERDHWKANHDNQVERARVLIERTDMPLERVAAYKQIGMLQRLVGVQKMMLEAFSGVLVPPEGVNPMGDGQNSLEEANARLREAYVFQQPLPVPDQMALVFRADIGRLRDSWIHLKACFENNVTKPDAGEAA